MSLSFPERIERHQSALAAFLRKNASGLLRFEELGDLLQGVITRAIASADSYEDQGDKAFLGWLYTLARRHVADRHAHWSALKRGAGQVLRLTMSGGSEKTHAAQLPPSPSPGPRTFAESREQIVLAIKALDTLPERDRTLVRWMSEGMDMAEQAQRLDMQQESTKRAANRALERYRKAFHVLATVT